MTSLLMTDNEITGDGAGGSGGAPITNATGGTSAGDAAAGYGDERPWDDIYEPITNGDKAGAAILTIILVGFLTAGCVWVSLDEGFSIGR